MQLPTKEAGKSCNHIRGVFFFLLGCNHRAYVGGFFFDSIIKKEKWVDKPHTKKLVGFDPLMPTISLFFLPYNFYRLKYIHSHIRRGCVWNIRYMVLEWKNILLRMYNSELVSHYFYKSLRFTTFLHVKDDSKNCGTKVVSLNNLKKLMFLFDLKDNWISNYFKKIYFYWI